MLRQLLHNAFPHETLTMSKAGHTTRLVKVVEKLKRSYISDDTMVRIQHAWFVWLVDSNRWQLREDNFFPKKNSAHKVMNKKTSTSDFIQQSRKKRSNLKFQSLKSWKGSPTSDRFSAPSNNLFQIRSWKIPPLSLENKKNVHDNHFACRNFCSSKVFCALMASGTPGTKGLEPFLLGNMAHLFPIPFSIEGRCLSPMVLDLWPWGKGWSHLPFTWIWEACWFDQNFIQKIHPIPS